MGEEVEFIPVEIPLEFYEQHVSDLLAHLLSIDEKLLTNESFGLETRQEVA